MGCEIIKIGKFLPKKILDNSKLGKRFPEWNEVKIEKKTGIKERHIAAVDETALDMGLKAAEDVLEKFDKELIDFVIFCTQSPDYYLPSGACMLQDKLGLRTDIGAIDINLGCSGYIYGLALAKSLINSNIASHVLFITSETYSKHINPCDKSNLTIFGDAATASIVSAIVSNSILEFVLGTDGSGAENLIVPNGGLRSRYNPEMELTESDKDQPRTANNLLMNGPEIFNFTISAVPKVVNAVLEKNQLELADVDFFIFHQANKFIIDYLRKKIKIPREKFYSNMRFTGNTVSSTIPLALIDCLENDTIKKGDLVMLVGFGVGYSWGGTIIKI
jgi:3-oxoacyl-[acyl-carrier-protein] synthase III